MSLLVSVLVGLIAVFLSRNPQGRVWRILVDAPARRLNQLTWRHVAVVVLTLIFLELFVQMAMPHMAVVLAVDVVGWIDVLVATLVVGRLLPGWRALNASVRQVVQRRDQRRPRTARARRVRRPAAAFDDSDPARGLVLA